jgi:hypothetical protein
LIPVNRLQRLSAHRITGCSTLQSFDSSEIKSSVSFDWLVWLCSETPAVKPFAASGSRHRYDTLDWLMVFPHANDASMTIIYDSPVTAPTMELQNP